MGRLALALACVLGMGLGIGCDSSEDVKDRFPDDIDTNLTLDAIGTSGLNKICSTFEEWVLDMYSSSHWVQAVCTAEAIMNNEGAASCGDELAACLDDPPAEVQSLIRSIQEQAGCSFVSVEASGCSATVGQIQDCLDALVSELDQVKFTITCAAAGEQLDANWWRIQMPAACTNLETACP